MITGIYSLKDAWSWYVGSTYSGNKTLLSIKDATYWNNGEYGWRGSVPCFSLEFDDGSHINYYCTDAYVEYKKEESK